MPELPKDLMPVDETHGELPSDLQEVGEEHKAAGQPDTRSLWQKFVDPYGNLPPEKRPIDMTGAMIKSLSVPGNAVSSAVLEGIKRFQSKGQEGLGGETWSRALHGETTVPQLLQEKFNMGKLKALALGLPLSIATDPYAKFLGGAAESENPKVLSGLIPEAEEAAAPVAKPILSNLLEGAGESTYASALKKVDQAAKRVGKEPVSKTLIEEGMPWGNADTMAEKMAEIGQNLHQTVKDAYEQAAGEGVRVDMGRAMGPIRKQLEAMRDSGIPANEDLAATFLPQVERYEKMGLVTPGIAAETKTSIRSAVPNSAYDLATRTPLGTGITKKMGNTVQQAIESATETQVPGLGQKIHEANARLGGLLTSKKAAQRAAEIEGNKNVLTSVDAIISGHPGILLTKKAADISKGAAFRTGLGKLIKKAGESKLADPAARRILLNLMNEGE